MAEREHIKEAPTENNLLYLLPTLMNDALTALDNIGSVNQETYSSLLTATEKLLVKLHNIEETALTDSRTLSTINRTEANKERMKQVKNDLL
ncbi:MAG: hypothetical protein ACI9ES_001383 [Oceanospirillaceae bacterium]